MDYHDEIENQKKIAYTAGLLQGDITIKTLLESLAEGVVIINEFGHIILINDRLSGFTGYEKHEVMGEHLNLLIPGKIHEKHNAHISGYFENPHIRPMGSGMNLNVKRKDNTIFPVEISLSFIITESGQLGIGFITDITSRKNIENELRERNTELDAYAHTVAHDLSSTLSGVVGFAELLLDSKGEIKQEEQDYFLKEIAQNGRKMLNIVRELLIFASMRKEDVVLAEVDMDTIIKNVLTRLRFQIEEKDARIILPESTLNCQGYSPWVEEIWLNFISNAIKYGGHPPVITLDCTKTPDGYIKYSVTDNGAGITDEFKTGLFNESTKVKEGLIKGFGLGLGIVKRFVEKLDGYVTVDSELNKGSKFCFYLKA